MFLTNSIIWLVGFVLMSGFAFSVFLVCLYMKCMFECVCVCVCMCVFACVFMWRHKTDTGQGLRSLPILFLDLGPLTWTQSSLIRLVSLPGVVAQVYL